MRATLWHTNQEMTMNVRVLRRVRQMFSNPDAPRRVNRHNQRQWVRSVRHLGGQWLLARPVERRHA